ncbi:high-affinity nicotinic acid transporter [Kwoniella heveanensis CBS 569]|nr:high-affinity nicotinic acid transporter [Kwoniella heveanensis CBS 569]
MSHHQAQHDPLEEDRKDLHESPRQDDLEIQYHQDESREITKVEDVDFSAYNYTVAENKSLVRKLDRHILPYIWACYLFNALDRNNLSNAKSDGMTTDLNFPNEGYGIMISINNIPWVLCVIPTVMLSRKIGPRFTIPGYMIGWGAMVMINAGVKNFAGTLVTRFLLGVFEAGFAPTLIYYLTGFYTRGELAKRVGVFYSCNALSGAFSGLIAYGVFQMDSKIHGWQILFLIEGAFTVAFAVLAGLMLPWSTQSASFFNEREKEVARLRVLKDSSGTTNVAFNRKTFFSPLKDWRLYVFALIAALYSTAASVAGSFLTQIVGRFGYSVVKTNLYTVAPFVFGAAMMLATATSSDHFRERGFHLVSALTLVFVGCIILVCTPISNHAVGYFAVFLITGGAQTPSVIFHSWHQSNDASEDGRAFKVAFLSTFANSGGFVSANIFLDKWAPAYKNPLAIVAAINGTGIVVVTAFRLYMAWDNRRRNKAQGVNWTSLDVPTEALRAGPKNPLFRYFL